MAPRGIPAPNGFKQQCRRVRVDDYCGPDAPVIDMASNLNRAVVMLGRRDDVINPANDTVTMNVSAALSPSSL